MSDVVTTPIWFGPQDRPLLGWISREESAVGRSGVLMAGPIGYEWWSSHRTLRTVAEGLAAAGHLVLRFDYDGTGDSAGSGFDPDRVAAWSDSLAAGVAELRALGCERVSALGTRLGGLLALVKGGELELERIVCWQPPASGKRMARELRMLSQPFPEEDPAITVSGMVFTGSALEELAALDLDGLAGPPAPAVSLVGSGLDPIAERLSATGCAVRVLDPPGGSSALEVPSEDAVVPTEVVETLLAEVGPAAPDGAADPPERAEATFAWDRGEVQEEVVRLGPRGLVGVLTTPLDGPGRAVVVWLNSGSEPHVGPGRAWVDYARALALDGQASLRLDFSGWGESPDLGHAPGRPYDAHGVGEAIEVVAALEGMGYERIVLAGLCAGAWIALRAVLERHVAGVFALNPQLYWQPGDPVEALMSETRERRTEERERERQGGESGLWTAEDEEGKRPWAGRWLDDLAAARTPVRLCFAAGDDGLEYLENRLGRRLAEVTGAGDIEVVEIPDIDHSMHRTWLRGRVVAVLGEFLDRLP